MLKLFADPDVGLVFGITTTIMIGLSSGAIHLTNMIPVAWADPVKAWAAFFAFVNSAALTAMHGAAAYQGPVTTGAIMRMLNTAAALALALVFGSPAYAADLPIQFPTFKAPTSQAAIPWSGFYLGGFGGYASNLNGVAVNSETPLASIAGEIGAAPRGALGGGQIGYDFAAVNNFVFGARADIALANISASNNITGISLGTLNVVTASNATNYLGTADLRVGYQIASNVMPYVVGGFAYGGERPNFQVGSLQAAAHDTSVGWDVGAGVEVRLAQNWSVFGEYDYLRLGDKQLSLYLPNGQLLATSDNKLDFGLVKIGANYRF